MPKMKTNKSAAKRFRKTATGKIKHNHAYTSHILTSKSTKRKRNLRRNSTLASGDQKRMELLLPY